MGILDDDVVAGPGSHRHRRAHQRAPRAEARRPALRRARARSTPRRRRRFSVNPELGLLLLLRLPGERRRDHVRAQARRLDFLDAVERLAGARRASRFATTRPRSRKDRQRKERLAEAVGAAIDFYHRILLEQPEGGRARGYLRSRGFDGDAARRFVLGWSPDGFDALSRAPAATRSSRATTSSTPGSRS